MQVDLKIVQLLCSRLCHDLSGPTGAIHNGVELLQESPVGDQTALDLVATSATQLKARLAFYRMAFGLGGPSVGGSPLREAHGLATSFFNGGKTALDWSQVSEPSGDAGIGPQQTGEAAKLLLNMILFIADSLPRGGALEARLAVSPETPAAPGAAIGLAVVGIGPGAFIKDERKVGLIESTEIDELSAHNVHGYFLRRLAQSQGGRIEISDQGENVQIAALLPGSD